MIQMRTLSVLASSLLIAAALIGWKELHRVGEGAVAFGGETRTPAVSRHLAEVDRLLQEGRNENALKLASEFFRAWKDAGHEPSRQMVLLYARAGDAAFRTRAFDAAKEYYRLGLDTLDALPSKDLGDAQVAFDLACCLSDLGAFETAKKYVKLSFEIRREKLGENNVQTATSLFELGNIHSSLGELQDAEQCYRRAHGVYVRIKGQEYPAALATMNLGNLSAKTGDYQAAREQYEASLGFLLKNGSEKDINVAVAYGNLGKLAIHGALDPSTGKAYLEKALRITKEIAPSDPSVVNCHNNLASLLRRLGDLQAAEGQYRLGLRWVEENIGTAHPDSIPLMLNLAATLLERGATKEAEGYVTRIRRGIPAVEGDTRLWRAMLSVVEGKLWERYDFEKAENAFLTALAMRSEVLGNDHPDVATTICILADLRGRNGRFTSAEQQYRQVLDLHERRNGPWSLDLALPLHNFGAMQVRRKRFREAAAYFDREQRILQRFVVCEMEGLSEAEQIKFLEQTLTRSQHTAFSLTVERQEDQALMDMSAEWLLNTKGLVFETQARRARLLRYVRSRGDVSALGELFEVRSRLAQLTFARNSGGSEPLRQTRINELLTRESKLLNTLRIDSSERSPVAPPAWLKIEALRQSIPPDAIFVDIKKTMVVDLETPELLHLGPRYLAWVVPRAGDGKVELQDLGNADQIESALAKVRFELRAAPDRLFPANQAEVCAEISGLLAELCKLVLSPLERRLDGKSHLIISPDASLWLVPWASLTLPDSRYAVEKYTFEFVTTGRALLAERTEAAKRSAALIVADPNYDLSPANAELETERALRGGQTSWTPGRALGRLAGQVPVARRLEGTALEAKTIEPSIARLCGESPRLLLGDEALEGIVKSVSSPKMLVLSTHAFFNFPTPSRPVAENEALELAALTKPAALSPLLHCGILLGACNRRGTSPDNSTIDDGVLTGLEIAGLDLRGTELVVLSACVTGVGETREGEGNASLQQAFLLAGAESVVATLWFIDDDETRFFMQAFFENLVVGQANSAALRNAQLARIQALRQKYGVANPFYWGAFTVTGCPR